MTEADADWPDLVVTVDPPRPRVPPGEYQARSIRVDAFELRDWGPRLIVWFEVIDPAEGRPLAVLPWYARLGAGRRRIRAGSKLAQLLDLLGPADPRRSRRRDRLPLTVLKHRLWRVSVRDVTTNARGRPLHALQTYSIVGEVLEHLA